MAPQGLDPRGPRFGAGITSVLMLLVIYLSLDPQTASLALAIMGFAAITFIFGVVLGPARHPYAFVYKTLIRPRLAEPTALEDPRPVRFAQLVGLIVTGSGLLLALVGLPLALPIAAAMAFIAAFLNASFAFCLGCLMYVGLKRIGLIS
jgi:hypothetical protein